MSQSKLFYSILEIVSIQIRIEKTFLSSLKWKLGHTDNYFLKNSNFKPKKIRIKINIIIVTCWVSGPKGKQN